MKRRTKEKTDEARRLSRKALESIREDNKHPGFDYAATLRELNKIYDYEEIAEFCRYKSKSSISKVLSGKRVPSHPQGELIYILYYETFNNTKPPNKCFQE
jgi:hypothetical protein